MNFYVFNARKVFKFVSIIILMVTIMLYVSFFSPSAVHVYLSKENNRKLPIYSVDTDANNISITFDCAWGADDIPRILKVLKDHNIKATFFVVGKWAEKYPDAIKLMVADGHEIAMHGYTHIRMGQLDSAQIIDEIVRSKEAIRKLIGSDTLLFRAPYGDYSNKVMVEAEKLGCYVIQWDVDSLDWKNNITKQDIINRCVSKTGSGSILLFHNDTQYTAEVIEEIITQLKQKGYNMVPVSQLIYKDSYYIDHNGKQRLTDKN